MIFLVDFGCGGANRLRVYAITLAGVKDCRADSFLQIGILTTIIDRNCARHRDRER